MKNLTVVLNGAIQARSVTVDDAVDVAAQINAGTLAGTDEQGHDIVIPASAIRFVQVNVEP